LRPLSTVAALISLIVLASPAAANGPAARQATASSKSVPAVSSAEHACLAEAIYFEATPAAASREAVAHVIVNRAESGEFPQTVCGVVKDGCQFSYRCSGKSLAMKDRSKRDGAVQTAAAAVLSGAPDPTRGALFFHSARAKPGWFSTRQRVGVIGGNVFYR
jgi:N-acetylmuramoyl-L-alanine amidase